MFLYCELHSNQLKYPYIKSNQLIMDRRKLKIFFPSHFRWLSTQSNWLRFSFDNTLV